MIIVLPAIALLALSAISRYVVGPKVEMLPHDYSSQVVYDTDAMFRESLDAPWTTTKNIGRRSDQVLTDADGIAVIQSSVVWSLLSGELVYQTSHLFGVERNTRRNVQGYGDQDRSGQFLFPPGAESGTFDIWDITYPGKQVATFERFETVDGLRLAVFSFVVTAVDDTVNYDYMADVPERYKGLSDGQGTYWVEPVSGIIVNDDDTGRTYFADPVTGKDLGAFSTWHNRYTPETHAALLQQAKQWRLKILAAKVWLPLFLAALGVSWSVAAAFRFWVRRRKGAKLSTNS